MDETEYSERRPAEGEEPSPGEGPDERERDDARRRAETMGDRLADTETDEAAEVVERAEGGDEAAAVALEAAGGPVPASDEPDEQVEPVTETVPDEPVGQVETVAEQRPTGDDVTDVPTEEATLNESEAERSLGSDTVEGEDQGALLATGPDTYVVPEEPGPAERPVPEAASTEQAATEEASPEDGERRFEGAVGQPIPEAGPAPEAEATEGAEDEGGEARSDRRTPAGDIGREEVPVVGAGVHGGGPVAVIEAEEEPDAARSLFYGPGDWYVIHTYAGYENKVKANLQSRIGSMQMEDKIFEVVIPMEDVMEIKAGKKQVVQKKVFPGYLLVKMVYDNDSWYVVRNTPGVTGFVSSGTGSKPTPLSKREVEKILAVKQETKVKPQYRLEWEEGDVVRIVAGPFADFTGTIAEINVEQSKLKVMVNIFDRETPVELAFDQVAKA